MGLTLPQYFTLRRVNHDQFQLSSHDFTLSVEPFCTKLAKNDNRKERVKSRRSKSPLPKVKEASCQSSWLGNYC